MSGIRTLVSASARISKLQGYLGFFRKRAGSSVGQKRAICVIVRKNLKKMILGSMTICFPISLTHLRHFRWLPDGAGIINHK
jgi:hypothetical protein